MPRKGSARLASARWRSGCSRGGNSNGEIAGVGARFRKPKFADSPAMVASSCVESRLRRLRWGGNRRKEALIAALGMWCICRAVRQLDVIDVHFIERDELMGSMLADTGRRAHSG